MTDTVSTPTKASEEANRIAGTSPLVYARVAGFLLLFIVLIAPFSQLYVPSTLIVPGDATATANNIGASGWVFPLGIVSDSLVFLIEIVLCVLLYVLLRPVSRTLSKTERSCQPVREDFEPWQGKFKRQRKKDQLLRYLRHARNADEHSIQLILDDIPGQTVTASSGDTVYVGNSVVTTSPRIELLPVEDRGKWYNPPAEHLGKTLAKRNPVKVAELGLTFYANFVEQAERKFFE